MVKSSFLFLFYLFTPSIISAQIDSTALFYSSFIDSLDLKRKVYTLSDDSLLGRETAREGQKRAEKIIISEFKNLGISGGNGGSYLQNFNVVDLGFNEIEIRADNKLLESESTLYTFNNTSDITIKASSYIFVGFGISSQPYDDYFGISVKNKVVFILDGLPKDNNGESILSIDDSVDWIKSRSRKTELAIKNGALAVVYVLSDYSNYYSKYKRYFNRRDVALLNNNERTEFPGIFMDYSSFLDLFNTKDRKIKERTEKKIAGKRVKKIEINKEISIKIKSDKKVRTSSNILAVITNNDSLAPWIVLSAHYDHIGYSGLDVFNGADDNASGTSAVIEIAKAFSKAKEDSIVFKKNILFLLVSGEEKGLLGSRYYTTNPIIDLSNTMVDLNIDMIGRIDEKHIGNENYVYVIGADKISQKLHDINEKSNLNYTQLELDYTFNLDSDPNRFYYRSDHYNFAKNGIPVIFYFNGTHDDYHQLGDTADKIAFKALTLRSKLVFHTAWYLATMNDLLLP